MLICLHCATFCKFSYPRFFLGHLLTRTASDSKLIYKNVTYNLPKINTSPLTALLLLTSEPWTRLQVETITQYVFENIRIPAFATLSTALAASFAYGVQDALVIDIGKDKTEITPIVEYTPVTVSQRTIKYGSSAINANLVKALPDLMTEQIEALKKSDIYEILSEDAAKNSWFGLNNLNGAPDSGTNENDDGIVDVAAIVTSGRTREILAQREKEKEQSQSSDKEKEKSNEDREFNTFTDMEGKSIQVGKERFHGAEELIEKITIAVGEVLKHLDDASSRQECWDNVIILGRGSSIKGFKEALLLSLQARYVISRPTMGSELPSMFNTSGYNTPTGSGTPSFLQSQQITYGKSSQGHGQIPVQIKVVKTLDYFPEWKNYGWEESSFLGAQIAAKQIFGGSVEGTYVSRTDYNEMGPSSIWDI